MSDFNEAVVLIAKCGERHKTYARIHTTEIQRIADYGISQGKEQFNDLRKVCKSQV